MCDKKYRRLSQPFGSVEVEWHPSAGLRQSHNMSLYRLLNFLIATDFDVIIIPCRCLLTNCDLCSVGA